MREAFLRPSPAGGGRMIAAPRWPLAQPAARLPCCKPPRRETTPRRRERAARHKRGRGPRAPAAARALLTFPPAAAAAAVCSMPSDPPPAAAGPSLHAACMQLQGTAAAERLPTPAPTCPALIAAPAPLPLLAASALLERWSCRCCNGGGSRAISVNTTRSFLRGLAYRAAAACIWPTFWCWPCATGLLRVVTSTDEGGYRACSQVTWRPLANSAAPCSTQRVPVPQWCSAACCLGRI